MSTVEMTGYFLSARYYTAVSDIQNKKTMFPWAGDGFAQTDRLHIIIDLTAVSIGN